MVWRRWQWMIPWVALGCGPQVATSSGQDGGGSADETTDDGSSSAAEITGDPTGGSGIDTSTGTDDTGTAPGRCFTRVRLDVAPLVPGRYFGALGVGPSAPAHLVFFDEIDDVPHTIVLATDAVDGPWLPVQELAGVRPHDTGDIDGDGLDDLVVIDEAQMGAWWGATSDGTLVERGAFAATSEEDALLRLPGEPRVGIAAYITSVWIGSGNGDGMFDMQLELPDPSREVSWSTPLVAHGEGILEVGTWNNDCIGFCSGAPEVLQIGDGGKTATSIGSVGYGRLFDVADIDGDGALDRILLDVDAGLRIHRGGQDDPDPPLAQPIDDAAAADLDADGDVDLVVAETGALTVHWNEAGSPGAAQPIDVFDDTWARLGQPVDLDGNGAFELVVSGEDAHELLHTVVCGG